MGTSFRECSLLRWNFIHQLVCLMNYNCKKNTVIQILLGFSFVAGSLWFNGTQSIHSPKEFYRFHNTWVHVTQNIRLVLTRDLRFWADSRWSGRSLFPAPWDKRSGLRRFRAPLCILPEDAAMSPVSNGLAWTRKKNMQWLFSFFLHGIALKTHFVYGKKKVIWNSWLNFLWKFYMVSFVLN